MSASFVSLLYTAFICPAARADSGIDSKIETAVRAHLICFTIYTVIPFDCNDKELF